jgi:hypothetical protein
MPFNIINGHELKQFYHFSKILYTEEAYIRKKNKAFSLRSCSESFCISDRRGFLPGTAAVSPSGTAAGKEVTAWRCRRRRRLLETAKDQDPVPGSLTALQKMLYRKFGKNFSQ